MDTAQFDSEHSNLHLTDLFPLEEIQALQDDFCKATGVASIITDAEGIPITQPSNFCRLCSMIRTTDKGKENCFKSDAAIGKQKFDGPTVCPCYSGGLWDAGASITLNGTHIANWLIGQVRDPSMTEQSMLSYAHEVGIDEDEYRQALREVQIMEKETFQKIANCLFIMANELSQKAYQNLLLKQAHAKLEAVNLGLEQRIQEELRQREEAQQRLFHSEKLVSLGRLISGLAHEINTPLGVAVSSNSWLRDKLSLAEASAATSCDLEAWKETADLTQRSLERVVQLVQGFKKLSTDHIDEECRAFDLHTMVNMVIKLVNFETSTQNVVMNNLVPADFIITSWAGDILMILSNIVHNAVIHGFSDGKSGDVSIKAWRDSGKIIIQVNDNGQGMPKELTDKPFEPFQTTRRGKGSIGLGLFAVHNTVTNRLNGSVIIEAAQEGGTAVTVELTEQ